MAFLAWIWGAIASIPGLLLPLFASPGERPRMRPWLRWTLHFLLLAVVLGVLGYLNYLFDLEMVLQAPYPFLRKIWLPLLFFLVYLLAWLGYWLYQLMQPEPDSAFPDIDAAWQEALAAMEPAGIDLTEAPLFLVLGRPAGTEEGLFAAGQMPLPVRNVPRSPDAPLHVFASRQGIFVTCANVSLLGRQAALFAGSGFGEDSERSAPAESAVLSPAANATLTPRLAPRGESSLVGAGQETHGVTTLGLATAPRARPALLRSSEEETLTITRLRHLCRLIAKARRPFCPLNGILVLMPWAATGGDAESKLTARLCQRDLAAVQENLRVQCPVLTVFCDLESNAGFRETVARLPEKQRLFRLGLTFPLQPDIEAPRVPAMFESGIRWMCDVQFPTLIYNLLQLAPPGPEHMEQLQGNVRLYQMMVELRDRRRRVSSLLTRGVARPSLLVGGCFLASTGPETQYEQAFVAGVFPLLLQYQNYVAWLAEPLAEEVAFRRWTILGYVGLALLWIFMLTLAVFV